MNRPTFTVLASAFSTALVAVFVAAPQLGAAPPPRDQVSWCGTSDTRLATSVLDHLARERPEQGAKLSAAIPSVGQSGDIAVIEDDGSLVSGVSLFDLGSRGVQFRRKKKTRVQAAPYGGPISSNLGERLELGDDDTVELPLPERFKFRFYGESYSSIHVNSDGNVTFDEGDENHSRASSVSCTCRYSSSAVPSATTRKSPGARMSTRPSRPKREDASGSGLSVDWK